jgi:protocatechuate 3,4-dioxygenase beta subunit
VDHAAPHVNFWVVARSINIGLNTRMYFPDESDANAADPVLDLIEHPSRREPLIARRGAGRRTRLRLRHLPPRGRRDGLLRHLNGTGAP